MDTISDKIRHIRELKNFTQDYMAQQLGMTQAGYSRIEMGATDVSYSKLIDIAKVLDVKVEDIVCFDGQKYFNSFNTKSYNNIQHYPKEVVKLYEDKIQLMQKLMDNMERELNRYRDRFGDV